MSIFDGIKWERVDYVALTLALMSITDSRLNTHEDDRYITDIIDGMNEETSELHGLESDLYYLQKKFSGV